MSTTLSPVAVTSRNLEEQIRSMLRRDESILARADSNKKYPFLMEALPFFGLALEFFRGRHELIVTDQRLILVRCRRLIRTVRSCQAVELAGVQKLELLKGFTQSSVRFTFAGGVKLKFGRISLEVAQQFYDRFPNGGLAQMIEASIRNAMEAPLNQRAMNRGPAHTSAV